MTDKESLNELSEKMKRDWDSRARENAFFHVASAREDWDEKEFFESGVRNVEEQILTDMINICQGMPPKTMKVLEIGCGVGRITRALAGLFGQVSGVDVSPEMISRAKDNLAGLNNVEVYQNNGCDLSVIPGSSSFDFAFSMLVFQHIPSRAVIESYVRDVNRLLKPGRLFKLQVQGGLEVESQPTDTWVGVPFTEEDARNMAETCGFEPRYMHGAGTQYFWLWYFKPPA